jgi:hypothetical protein
MGWDAYSSAEYLHEVGRFKNPLHTEAFEKACAQVKELGGTVDAFLEMGSLDCSACCRMLEEATGESCYNEEGWNADKVQELSEKADWRILYDNDDAWAYWSARKFLETCAELNLSIEFSW